MCPLICPLLQVLIGNNVPFNLPSVLEQAAPLQPIPISHQQIQQVTDFVVRRLEQVLVDGGTSVEAVRAVLKQRGNSPALAAASAHQLQVTLSCVLMSEHSFICSLDTFLSPRVRTVLSIGKADMDVSGLCPQHSSQLFGV